MEEELCLCFYTILCCVFCCPPIKQPLKSQQSQEVIIENPGSLTGLEKEDTLKSESDLKKDGLAV